MIDRDCGTFDQYKTAMHEGFQQALAWGTELLIYQAGIDCHQDDSFGSAWCDTEALFHRDLMVFEFAKKHRIPVMFVLAGGYQEMADLVRLHINTFLAANQVYFPHVRHKTVTLA